MDRDEALERLRAARVGRIATVRPDGSPHVVPFVFAVLEDGGIVRIVWVVDRVKPKRSGRLARLENLRHDARVEVVVDAYDEDWSSLWWVRASGRGRVVDDEAERDAAVRALAERYEPYRALAGDEVVVAIDVERLSGWSASER
jgi:PPOX class probable F420-dependent enzyme